MIKTHGLDRPSTQTNVLIRACIHGHLSLIQKPFRPPVIVICADGELVAGMFIRLGTATSLWDKIILMVPGGWWHGLAHNIANSSTPVYII